LIFAKEPKNRSYKLEVRDNPKPPVV